MYYKILKNNLIIDVVKNPYFTRFLSYGHIAFTDKFSAQGIVGSNGSTVYSFKPVDIPGVTVATIEEINEMEFNRLQSLLNSDQELCADETVLTQTRKEVLKNLSNICKNKIKKGFSVNLSDGNTYSFSLTTEDQLNLISIESQLNLSDNKSFIYHANGQPCRSFSRNDMLLIIKAFRHHVLYHTTYFNVAKQYINKLNNIEKIKSFAYDTDLVKTVTDPDIKKILRDGSTL